MELSNGNHKIGNDTLIFNMSSATECPSLHKGMCDIGKRCYALKAEKQYPSVKPYRNRQKVSWLSDTAESIFADIMLSILSKRNEIKFIRFNESGDFHTQACVDKLATIADGLLSAMPNIKVYGYTARRDLNYSVLPENVTVNGSGFMVHNSFTATDDVSNGNSCVGNCRICDKCKSRCGNEILVEYH